MKAKKELTVSDHRRFRVSFGTLSSDLRCWTEKRTHTKKRKQKEKQTENLFEQIGEIFRVLQCRIRELEFSFSDRTFIFVNRWVLRSSSVGLPCNELGFSVVVIYIALFFSLEKLAEAHELCCDKNLGEQPTVRIVPRSRYWTSTWTGTTCTLVNKSNWPKWSRSKFLRRVYQTKMIMR